MNLESKIEAILFWKGEPISRKRLGEILKVGEGEIILALPSTKLGDFTCEYIKKTLIGSPVSITRLGRGISYGVELEYADENTLKHAFTNRK